MWGIRLHFANIIAWGRGRADLQTGHPERRANQSARPRAVQRGGGVLAGLQVQRVHGTIPTPLLPGSVQVGQDRIDPHLQDYWQKRAHSWRSPGQSCLWQGWVLGRGEGLIRMPRGVLLKFRKTWVTV